jgi:phage tail sheath gpL-like
MGFEVDVLPVNTRTPGTYIGFDTRNALLGLNVGQKSMLFVGQKTADGGAQTLERYPVSSESAAINLFGRGSSVHIMARNALATNPYGAYFAIAVENNGIAASGKIEVTVAGSGAATGGRIRLVIGQEVVAAVVAAGDSADDIANKIYAASLNENLSLQVNVNGAIPGAVINLTAKCAGESGNTIGISTTVEDAAGVSIEITRMSEGADDINAGDLFDKLSSTSDNIIAYPYDWSDNKLEDYLAKVTSPIERNSVIAIIGRIGDLSTAIFEGAGATVKLPDNPRIAFVNMRDTYCPLEALISSLGAQILSKPDPAEPFDDNLLPSLSPDSRASDYLRQTKDRLLRNGVTPLQIARSGGVSITRLISAATSGVSRDAPDMWIRTLDYVREAISNDLKSAMYNQKDTQRSAVMIRAVILGTLLKLDEAEIIKNVRQWATRLTVERDSQNIGFLRARIPADAVIGLHGLNGMIDLIIS